MESLTGDDPVELAGYQLRGRLGSGGMGRVYLAFTQAGRPVALKVVRSDLGDDAEFRRRFRQEVEASRRVHGMYTAQVLDADPDASPPWLVTAYVPGPSLQQAVAEHGPMPEQTVLVLMAGVAEALAAIHAAGIVHRDLKPSNVLLAPDGPRVIDFGIARAAGSTSLTRTGMVIGSPPFMAPEQVKGDAITQAVDVFALGAVAVFAATGRSAFGDGPDMGILYRVLQEEPDLSGCTPRLRETVERCLAKDPAARPSPAEIITACRAQAAGPAAGIASPWLPADVLAALAQHVPPPSPQQLSPHALQATHTAQAARDRQPSWVPTHPSVSPAAPTTADRIPAQGAAQRLSRAVRTRPAVLGGVFGVVGVAALAVAGVLALGGHHGNSGGPSNPSAARSLAAARQAAAIDSSAATKQPSTQATSPSPHAKKSPASAGTASAKPKQHFAIDSCLVGTWKDAGDVLINTTASGQRARFTGRGGSYVFRADGSVTQQLGPETLTSTIDGNIWAEVLTGSITMHATTGHGEMSYSDIAASSNAIYKLYENGIYNSSGPMSASTVPERYTCSATTLRTTWSDGSSTYDRQS